MASSLVCIPLAFFFLISIKKGLSITHALSAVFAPLFTLVLAMFIQYGMHLLYYPSSAFFGMLYQSFIIAGLVEESVKYAVFLLVLTRLTYQNRTVLFFTPLFGLSFATFESLAYLLTFSHITVRFFTAMPLHIALSFIYLDMAHSTSNPKRRGLFLLAVLIHGSFNFFLQLGGFFTIISVVSLCYAFWVASTVYQKFRQ